LDNFLVVLPKRTVKTPQKEEEKFVNIDAEIFLSNEDAIFINNDDVVININSKQTIMEYSTIYSPDELRSGQFD
jgi:hypothetical protein